MNKFIQNLNSRERSLLIAAFTLVMFFIVFLFINSFVSDYRQAKHNLNKASGDYEYVKNRIRQAIKSNQTKAISSEEIKNYIFNQLESKYKFDNLSVGLEDNVLIIEFSTSNLKDGINLIADTANHIEKDVLSLSITKKGDSNNITAKFNI
jgi:flagellar biosynthesis protein FliP